MKIRSWKKKYKRANNLCDDLYALVAEMAEAEAELREKNKELEFRCISLELEVKKKTADAEKFYQAARAIAKKNKELKDELLTRKIRYDYELKKGVKQ